MKLCKRCNLEKDDGDYYIRTNGKPNYSKCKDCTKEYNRNHSMKPEIRERRLANQKVYATDNRGKLNQYLADYYATKQGRAKSLMKSAHRRGMILGCDIDESFILKLMESDVCSVTGIVFDYEKPEGTKKNPYAPSLDRIDSTRGYYRDNVRLVIWQYNLMKGEITDEQLFNICKEIVNGRS